MNLLDLCTQLKPTDDSTCLLPQYLLGAFRRKSITFANGLTDENTLVYWFQSKTFTIDLRLKDPRSTPVLERQGWVGDTLWDAQNQLLSCQQSLESDFRSADQQFSDRVHLALLQVQ